MKFRHVEAKEVRCGLLEVYRPQQPVASLRDGVGYCLTPSSATVMAKSIMIMFLICATCSERARSVLVSLLCHAVVRA